MEGPAEGRYAKRPCEAPSVRPCNTPSAGPCFCMPYEKIVMNSVFFAIFVESIT